MDNSDSVRIITSDERGVTGTFVATGSHAPGARFLRPSTLFSYAESLLVESAAVPFDSAVLVDSSAQFIDLAFCDNINAEAKLMDRRQGYSAWDIRFADQSDAEIARIKLSYLSLKTSAPTARAKPVSKSISAPSNKSESKRDRIARAACEVIAEKGFAAATMREIATAADMHVPTMYQYVRSKEEVLILVYTTEIACVRENVRDALAADLPPLDKLLGITASLVRGNGRKRKEAGVLNRELRSLSHEARRHVLADYAELMTEISQTISDGILAGEIREVEPKLIANMIDAICDLWALRPFALAGVQEEDFLRQVLDLIRNGLCKTA